MATPDPNPKVRLDLNNPVFQEGLFGLQKPERLAALDTLGKLRRLTWDQVYRDPGLKSEKIVSVKPPTGVTALYSLRITPWSRLRASALRSYRGWTGTGHRRRVACLSGGISYNPKVANEDAEMSRDAIRTARLEARLAPEALAVVKRAAEIQGRSVSDFVVAAAAEIAHRTIEETSMIRLSLADQRRFVELLLNPPAPAPALERAAQAHSNLIQGH